MKNYMPNFLIVGAAKCGTSSLHNYLNQHPDIFMPSYNARGMKVKEPRFLVKEIIKNRVHNGVWDFKEYKSLFSDVKHEKLIGESTVLYLYYYETAIKNIKHYLGNDIKIIIMLRKPVDRAFSAYLHVSRGKKENLSFEEALKIEKERLKQNPTLSPMVNYQDMGMYYKMVKSYLDNFKNVHIIFYEDFKKNTNLSVKNTFKFLNVDSNISIDTTKKHNVGGKVWRYQWLKDLFFKKSYIKVIIKNLLPKKLVKNIFSKIEFIIKKRSTPMSKQIRKELLLSYTEDITKLEELLKIDLKHWKE